MTLAAVIFWCCLELIAGSGCLLAGLSLWRIARPPQRTAIAVNSDVELRALLESSIDVPLAQRLLPMATVAPADYHHDDEIVVPPEAWWQLVLAELELEPTIEGKIGAIAALIREGCVFTAWERVELLRMLPELRQRRALRRLFAIMENMRADDDAVSEDRTQDAAVRRGEPQ